MGNDEAKEENKLNALNRTYKGSESNSILNRINEMYTTSNKYVIFGDVEKIRKSICKIKWIYESKKGFGTGFFIDFNSYKYLITNYHIISKEKKQIEIEIWDKSNIKLNLNNRYIIYLPEPKDITIIRLKTNEIDKIEYLFFDLNYSIGYNYYKENEVLTAGYPKGKKLATGAGIIKEVINEYEFFHNIPTELGSSGSPVILFNTLKVIGIHKQSDIKKKLNVGTFIGEAIKEINGNKFNNLNKNNKNSAAHIEPTIKNIRNVDNNLSYTQKNNSNFKEVEKFNNLKSKTFMKGNESNTLDIKYDVIKNKNEINCIYIVNKNNEINLLYDFKENVNDYINEDAKRIHNEAKKAINEENIDIYINNTKIKFNTKYKSYEAGLINVKFKIKKLLTSTGFMFKKCTALKSIDLSSFNASNVTNMYDMFYECSSLESINLSSLNTNNVTNFYCMFNNCSSLKSIDLSSFNTNKVTDMRGMFQYCKSLESLDLSSFNTNKVINMSYMFNNCISLKFINLSTFNTNNVTNMSVMFQYCKSLKSIDLSSFNTNNVTYMSFMFTRCYLLNSLNLSSFNTNNVTNMRSMFSFCKSLKSLNLSSFDTTNVTDMYGMFFHCDLLESIDLSSFDTSSIINMEFMFNFCSSLKKQNIKVSEKGTKILDEFKISLISNIFKTVFK